MTKEMPEALMRAMYTDVAAKCEVEMFGGDALTKYRWSLPHLNVIKRGGVTIVGSQWCPDHMLEYSSKWRRRLARVFPWIKPDKQVGHAIKMSDGSVIVGMKTFEKLKETPE